MKETVPSRAGVPIRLTDERWAHIFDEHRGLAGLRGEILETVSDAERVVSERMGERVSRSPAHQRAR